MAVETATTLTDETIEHLQGLIRINIDSFEGLTEAAEVVDDETIASLFRRVAADRERFANQLKMHVEWNDETPVKDQSYASKLHQFWMEWRAKLNDGDPAVVLSEAEYGEDQIKAAYEDALKENPGSAMNQLLHSQYESVKSAHDQIRDLRDACKTKC